MERPKATASWRDSSRGARLWVFDASAFFPLLVMLFHIRLWTFLVALFFVVFLTVIRYYGFSPRVFGRVLLSILAGKRKLATPWWLG